MSFPTELDAFRAYVRTFPKKPTLLIDTYDTLEGARNAAVVGKELETMGQRLGSVRLDSGDLAELSKQVRQILDSNRLPYVTILASNDLNEYKIAELKARGARIDGYGVGTEMITAKPTAAISGVYKLVADGDGAKIKLAPDKITYPGIKQVYRVEENGRYTHDVLALENERVDGKPLLEKVVENGKRIKPRRSLSEIRTYSLEEVAKLPLSARELCAVPYGFEVSPGLSGLVHKLKEQYGGKR
jgi:nicotinate phosphoribosyltransferase